MEKIITIDGREVGFRSTGALPLRYKSEFGVDLFADLGKLDKFMDSDGLTENFDTEVFYRIAWTMAKTYDAKIPEMMKWLDGFNEFPVFEVFAQLNELLTSSMQSSKK